MKLIYSLIFGILIIISHSASAIRCNSKLAVEGDSAYKFLKVCGEPSFVKKSLVYAKTKVSSIHIVHLDYHSHDHPNTLNNQPDLNNDDEEMIDGNSATAISHENEYEITLEEWTYDFGSSRLIQIVTFVDGIATKVESQGYGF